MKSEEKTCWNCRFFIKHYIKYKGYLSPVLNCGHCIKRDIKMKDKRFYFEKSLHCEFWETQEKQKAERQETIEALLRKMADQIEQISLILKEDN